MNLEEVTGLVRITLLELDNDSMVRRASHDGITSNMEEQCQLRFGMNWTMARRTFFRLWKQMGTFDTNVLSSLRIYGSGNWMIDRLLEVWFLQLRWQGHYGPQAPQNVWTDDCRGTQRALERLPEQLTGVPHSSSPFLREHRYALLYVAPFLCPEETRAVLASHGLKVRRPR